MNSGDLVGSVHVEPGAIGHPWLSRWPAWTSEAGRCGRRDGDQATGAVAEVQRPLAERHSHAAGGSARQSRRQRSRAGSAMESNGANARRVEPGLATPVSFAVSSGHGTDADHCRLAILVPLVQPGGLGSCSSSRNPEAAPPRRLSHFYCIGNPDFAKPGAASSTEGGSQCSVQTST